MKIKTLIKKLQQADPEENVYITTKDQTIEKIGVSYDDNNAVELYEVAEEEEE
ncbi:MAG: hypothetical protein WC332_00270 [Clostridia bacterium]|jgi:hypothetical protein